MATNQIETEITPDETYNHLLTNHQEKEIKGTPSEDFLLKMLHPPRAQRFEGLPTNDTRSQVTTEYVNMVLQSASRAFTGSGTTYTLLTNPTRLAFLQLSGLRILQIAFVISAAGDKFFQDVANTVVNSLYDFKNRFAQDVQLYRPTYRSHTSTLNATMFNNTGMVSVNQFNPNIMFRGFTSSFALQKPAEFVEFITSLYKTGSVQQIDAKSPDFEKQINLWRKYPKWIRDDISERLNLKTGLNLSPDANIQILYLGAIGNSSDFVPDSAQILTQSSRSYGGPAKEGTFTVSRLNTLTPEWLSSSNMSTSTFSEGLFQCFIGYREIGGPIHILALDDPTSPAPLTTRIPLFDTAWSDNMTASWTLYEGLSYNAQALPTANQQILIHKFYQGAELQPALQSSFAGMARLAPRPNMMLMQKLMDAFYDQKDSMPARYNFLGTLLKAGSNLIMKHAPKIFTSFMGEIGEMNGKTKNKKEKKETEEIGELAEIGLNFMKSKNTSKKGSKKLEKVEKELDKAYIKAGKNANKAKAKQEVKKEKKILKKAAKSKKD